MFTGIIEEIGTIKEVRKISGGIELVVAAHEILDKIKQGDSVAIDGVCQTVIALERDHFFIQAVGETLTKSTFGEFQQGRKVNLESSLTLSKPLGGHMVQGHVQNTAEISKWQKRGDNYYLELRMSESLMKYCVAEGAIALDGISLTIAELFPLAIGISVVPYTVNETTLREKSVGDRVNIETDIIARYVEKFTNMEKDDGITREKLKSWGY
jgi:riboflavin synthase